MRVERFEVKGDKGKEVFVRVSGVMKRLFEV